MRSARAHMAHDEANNEIHLFFLLLFVFPQRFEFINLVELDCNPAHEMLMDAGSQDRYTRKQATHIPHDWIMLSCSMKDGLELLRLAFTSCSNTHTPMHAIHNLPMTRWRMLAVTKQR